MLKLWESILIVWCVVKLTNAATESDLLTLYDLKVKNNEPTCRLVNHPNLPEDRRTLAGRGCMCDEECIKYKDCCKDSPYYRANEQSISPSHDCNEYTAVYLQAQCPSEWEDSEIKELCEKSAKPLDSEDISMILPISNIKTREVYGNKHCAACYNDADNKNWVQFPMGVACGEAPPGYLKPIKYKSETTTSTYNYLKPPPSSSKYISQVTSNELTNEFEKENCNHNCQVKVINNILTHPPPGILLDIHLYLYNDTVVNGGVGQWPVELKTVTLDDSEISLGNLLGRRSKRDSKPSIDFKKYKSKAAKICANPVYDKENKEFVSRYDNKNFICKFVPLLPENSTLFTRSCVPQMEPKCPDGYKNEAIKKECAVYTNIVYDKKSKKPYRNKDCARCNGKKEDSVDGAPQQTRADVSNVAESRPTPPPPEATQPDAKLLNADKFAAQGRR